MKALPKFIFVTLAIMALGLGAGEAKATLYNLQYLINGWSGTETNWVTANFQQNGANTVTLTITGVGLTSGLYVDQLAFNVASPYASSTNPLTITGYSVISGTVGTITFAPGTSITTQNTQSVSGSGSYGKGFDVLLNFPNPQAQRFNGTDSVLVTLTGSGLTASAFDVLNTANPPYPGANVGVHIAGFPADSQGNTSAFITNVPLPNVPIPGAAWLLGSGLFGLVAIRCRMKK